MNAPIPDLAKPRRLRPEEFGQSLDLLEYSFRFKAPPERRARLERNFAGESVWGIFGEAGLQSQLCALPYDVSINKRHVASAGITRASSYPEYRHGGNIARLLRHVVAELRADGRSFALLAPFDIGFYRRFGWELVSDFQRLRVPHTRFPDWRVEHGRVLRREPAAQVATEIYNRHAAAYNAVIVRTPSWWNEITRIRKTGEAATAYDRGGAAVGYAIYDFRDAPVDPGYQYMRGPRELVVQEIAYTTEAARRDLWAFLFSHASMVDGIAFTGPPDETLGFEIPDASAGRSLVPFMMGRIVDLKRFVADFAFGVPGAPTRLRLAVSDALAPWNDGAWLLDVDAHGKGRLCRDPEPCFEAIHVDIGALTAALVGYQRPSLLARARRLAAPDEQLVLLERLIPEATPYLADFF